MVTSIDYFISSLKDHVFEGGNKEFVGRNRDSKVSKGKATNFKPKNLTSTLSNPCIKPREINNRFDVVWILAN